MKDKKKVIAIMELTSGVPGEKPGVVVIPDQEMEDGSVGVVVGYYSEDIAEGCLVYLGVPYKSDAVVLSPHDFRKASKEEVNFYKVHHAKPSNTHLH